MASAKITWDDRKLMARLLSADKRIATGVGVIMRYNARYAQSYARRNAKWRDRTGNARGGLLGTYTGAGNSHKITISHSVSYGVWLETRWSGRYAILRPTVNHVGPKAMSMMGTLFSRLAGR